MGTKRKTVKAPTKKAAAKRKTAKAPAKKAAAKRKTAKAPAKKAAAKRKTAKAPAKSEAAEAQPIVLDSVLDLRAATPLAGEFRERRGADVEIDASNVERLGAQCAQVLLSAEKTWAAEGLKLSITDSSPEFQEGLGVLAVQLGENQMNGADA